MAGNRTGVTEGSGWTITWAYDNAYRLTSEADSAAPGITTTYSYDAVGNRLSLAAGSLTTNYKYNELDQLTTVLNGTTPTSEYSYVRGNLVQVKNSATNAIQQSYTWDSADRLVGATVASGSATYGYDADNRRIKQTASGVVTNYLWDETSAFGDVLIETDGSNIIKTSYILGNGELISQKRVGATTPEYYLKDGQGSVRNLTDNTGNLVGGQNYTYDAFGVLKSGQPSPASNYLYTGQQFDVLTGLYDLRVRYYKPNDGRFLSRDLAQSNFRNPVELNRYGYTANNPINFNDPTGFAKVITAGNGGASEYSLIQSVIDTFLVAGVTALGLATACLVALDVSTVIANTGGDPDIVPAPPECKAKSPKCKAEIFARFITTGDITGIPIPLGAAHTYIMFTNAVGQETIFNAGPENDKLKSRLNEGGYVFKQKCEESTATCAKLSKLEAYSDAVDRANIDYQILGPNSNSYIHGALSYSGIRDAKPFWWIAPGWNTNLNVNL